MDNEEETRLLMQTIFIHGMLSSGRWTLDDNEKQEIVKDAKDLALLVIPECE